MGKGSTNTQLAVCTWFKAFWL